MHVATASFDNTARRWDVATGKILDVFQHAQRVNTASFSPDRQFVVTACFDGIARIWDLRAVAVGDDPASPNGRSPIVSVPNPASDAITVTYALRASGHVRISLVNALGETVALLADGQREGGEHSEALAINGVPPGGYTVIVDAAEGRRGERIVVVR
jgi:WD40 repeat protein